MPGAVIVGKHPQLHLCKAVFLRLLQRLFHQKRAEPQPPRFFLDRNAETGAVAHFEMIRHGVDAAVSDQLAIQKRGKHEASFMVLHRL